MDKIKMLSFATKICVKLPKSRGMRADPLEWGGRGVRAAQPAGDGGRMEMRAVQKSYGYPLLWGSRKGTGRQDNRQGCLTARGPRFSTLYDNLRFMCAMNMAVRESNVI